MVLKGVKQVSKDSNTITVKTYPSKKGYEYKLSKHTWKNYCPLCKAKGTLTFNPKGTPEGEITCSACDADYCGTSGKDKAKKVRAKLTPASVTSNGKVNVAQTETQSQKCNLTRAESKKKAQSLINTGTTYAGKLEIPAYLRVKVDDPLSLKFTDFVDKQRFKDVQDKRLKVSKVSLDVDNQKLSVDLTDESIILGEPYEGDYIITNKNGAIVATNRNKRNPLKGKPSSINPKIGGFNEQSTTIKKIMLKGQELGTVNNIYKYLKVKSAGGTGGFQYRYYIGHKVSSEKETEFGKKSAEKCWTNKYYNCVDASWLFYIMAKGAKKNVDIIKAEYVGLDGEKRAHMYNRYKGRTYDVSQNMRTEVDGSSIVVVKK